MKRTGETNATYLGDVFRTIDCMSKRHGQFVNVHLNPEFAAASYGGLVTCGSVWACPLCAAKVQERRRCEIEAAMNWNENTGGTALMVTLTFPHMQFDTLADLLTKQAQAFVYFRRTKAYARLVKSTGFRGLIRSLEVTHGMNGWHPHTHELWFVLPGVDQAKLRDDLMELWRASCVRSGLLDASSDHTAFERHSVDVRSQVGSADYLAKQDDSRSWGLAAELAKSSSKAGRAKGVHPHHFLVRKARGDDAHYLEYVRAMKGKRQLFWSHGLKGIAGINDISDEELAEQTEEGSYLLALIPAGAWRFVLGNDARCEVLDAAESGGLPAITALLRVFGVPEHDLPLSPADCFSAERSGD